MADVVYVSGTWDLFHVGHLRRLQKARELGDYLIVGVCSDEYVATYKQPPAIPLEQRMEIVEALSCVDEVIVEGGEDSLKLAKERDIAVRVVGPQWGQQSRYQIEFLNQAEDLGVQVVVQPRTPGVSTSMIKERIRDEEHT